VPLPVRGGPGQLDDLRCQIDPLGGATGSPQHVVAREQARGQGRRVIDLAGEGERPLRQRPGPGTVLGHRVGELSGQVRGDLRLQRRAGAVQSVAGGLEQFDHCVAGHGEPGAEPLHPEGDVPESLRVAECGGPAGGVVEQAACRRRVTSPGPGVGLLDEQVDQRPACVRHAGVLDRAASSGQVAGRLGKSESSPLESGRGSGPADRPFGAVERDGGRAVPGQVRRLDGAAAGVAVLECVGDPLMQGHPLRDSEPTVDRLAEQVVREPRPALLDVHDQDAGVQAFRDQYRCQRRIHPAHLRQHVGLQLIAGHRSRPDQLPASDGQPFYATGHEVVRGRRQRTRRAARIREQLGELSGQERMSAGAPVHLARPARGCLVTDGIGDEGEHLLR
jgi:hypothetical protein